MGRKRRIPRSAKEATELERLRRNQQRCRDKKIGLVDEYNKAMDKTKEDINEKIVKQQKLLQELNQLRVSLSAKQNAMIPEERAKFAEISKWVEQTEKGLIELQNYVRKHVNSLTGCAINRRKNDE